MGWLSNNLAPHYVRATGIGFLVAVANCAAFVATFSYLAKDACVLKCGRGCPLLTESDPTTYLATASISAPWPCVSSLSPVVYCTANGRTRRERRVRGTIDSLRAAKASSAIDTQASATLSSLTERTSRVPVRSTLLKKRLILCGRPPHALLVSRLLLLQ